jgi:hypothetical protein
MCPLRPELGWYYLYWMDEFPERQRATWYDRYWWDSPPRHRWRLLNSDISAGWLRRLLAVRPTEIGAPR